MPARMMTAMVGLKLGKGTMTRAATAKAHITASKASSLACGLRRSKERKKTAIVMAITSRAER